MDREEAGQVVERYGSMVYRLAYARTGRRDDAEDVTQEVFLRLVRSAPDFRDEEHRKAWLLRVTVNCAGDLFRAPWRRHSRPLDEADGLPAPEREESGVLDAVLSLPERYRAVVHLFYYEELSVAEIAAILGRSQGAVRTRLSRARALLRELLEEEGETHVSR
ncbi:sigma-70 family RNA polymerase sigma factor [Pseudoflavonifractor gallinarum]|uniref:RNA polymerase sigma factor n=1 Tax=Pseudoflavonifractor gallinarum TaxID=2779352 RepID=UPI000C7738A0